MFAIKNILFIRHGATAGNLEKRYIGRSDEPLCELGVQQIEKLRPCHFYADFLFSSPMLRTRQTAELLFPQQSASFIDDFRESDFGIFEGKTADELSNSPEYQQWLDSFCLDPIPQGESVADFKARCCTAFEQIVQTLPNDCSAAFVVHGGVIMAILEQFVQPKRDFYQYHISNGEYVRCVLNDDDGTISMKVLSM